MTGFVLALLVIWSVATSCYVLATCPYLGIGAVLYLISQATIKTH